MDTIMTVPGWNTARTDGATNPDPANGWRRKACLACTKSKRQCNKQTPICRRCRERNVPCQYPRVRQISTLSDDDQAWETSGSVVFVDEPWLGAGLGTDLDIDSFLSSSHVDTDLLQLSTQESARPRILVKDKDLWFLTSRSWSLRHIDIQRQPECLDGVDLQQYVSSVQAWLQQWVSEGHNSFIHRQLYRLSVPRCIQDAYTVLSAYLSRKPGSEDMTFRIMQERVGQLLREYPVDSAVGTSEQLARVQALLIYQAVQLFDGNIRMRAQAEHHIPLLFEWVDQLWENAGLDLKNEGSGIVVSSANALGTDAASLSWRLWILAESIRRTCLTAKILQSVYMTMKQTWVDCPGALFFTARQGIWDAPSAYSWSKACQASEPLFASSADSENLFGAKHGNIDAFGHAMLAITFGRDRMESWLGESSRAA